jgi:hypothetical protein
MLCGVAHANIVKPIVIRAVAGNAAPIIGGVVVPSAFVRDKSLQFPK